MKPSCTGAVALLLGSKKNNPNKLQKTLSHQMCSPAFIIRFAVLMAGYSH